MTRTRTATVLEVTPNLDIGGAQETVRTIAKYLPRHGMNVVVCSFRDGELRAEIEALGVPVELLSDRRRSVIAFPFFFVEMIRQRRELIALIAKHHVSFIQTQGLGSLDFLVMTLAKRAGVWWTIQNAEFQLRREHLPKFGWLLGAKRLAHRILYRLGQSVIQGVIAVSDETADSYKSYVGGKPRIETITNAVDVETFPASVDREALRADLGLEAHHQVAIVVATFKRQKGHSYLVDAVTSLSASMPNLRVLLVGDGELRPRIEEQVAERGLAHRFVFLGSRRDVGALLAASDAFVLPSLWEGLSVALLEAMASGTPVVATDVSGTRELIIDGVTGMLVPAANGQALAKAIAEVINHPDRSRQRAAAARELVSSRFSADLQAQRLIQVLWAVTE